MKQTPWIPQLAAIAFMTLAVLVALIIPETLPSEVVDQDRIISTAARPDIESTSIEAELLGGVG